MSFISTISSIAGFDNLTAHSSRNLESTFIQFPKYILELNFALFCITWRQSTSCPSTITISFQILLKGQLSVLYRKEWITGKSIKQIKSPANQNTLAMCSWVNWNCFVTRAYWITWQVCRCIYICQMQTPKLWFRFCFCDWRPEASGFWRKKGVVKGKLSKIVNCSINSYSENSAQSFVLLELNSK